MIIRVGCLLFVPCIFIIAIISIRRTKKRKNVPGRERIYQSDTEKRKRRLQINIFILTFIFIYKKYNS